VVGMLTVGGPHDQAAPPLGKLTLAPRAQDGGADVIAAAGLLPAGAEHLGSVVVLVHDAEVVVDVAKLRAGTLLPAARAVTADRVAVAQEPGTEVEEVDVLLDVEVAG